MTLFPGKGQLALLVTTQGFSRRDVGLTSFMDGRVGSTHSGIEPWFVRTIKDPITTSAGCLTSIMLCAEPTRDERR